jgi:hypothetical protein
MKEVFIEIEDRKLNELGVAQNPDYTLFRFKESHFVGYWQSTNSVSGDSVLVFYVGSETFNCRNTQKNRDIFESILNK